MNYRRLGLGIALLVLVGRAPAAACPATPGGVVYVEDFLNNTCSDSGGACGSCVANRSSCADPMNCDFCILDDDDRWQAAINCAGDPTTGVFGTVVGKGGKTYQIADTITVFGVDNRGVIDGNAARLRWAGPTGRPMWKLIDVRHLQLEHMQIFTDTDTLETAIEFTNAAGGFATGSNVIDHVTIQAVGLNDLNYGIRFALGVDQNNDQTTIKDTQIFNPTEAAISIEHGQSVAHKFINVVAMGALGAPASRYVNLVHGSFTSIGGFHGRFSDAEYVIQDFYERVFIIDDASEANNRMIRAEPRVINAYPLHIIGGRFAVDALNADGKVIDYPRPGPLIIDGMRWDGTPPGGVTPKVSYSPSYCCGWSDVPAPLQVTNCRFGFPNSNAYDIINVNNLASVNTHGNTCSDGTGGGGPVVPCKGLAAGALSFYGVTYAELSTTPLSTLPDGHATYCKDCKADASTGACQSSGPGAFATRIGGAWKCDGGEVLPAAAQVLSSKDLTSPTNVFPESQLVAFTYQGTTSGTRYCAPNGSLCHGTESQVALPFPNSVLRTLACKASAAPGGSRSISMQLRSGGSDTGITCPIPSGGTSCNSTASFAMPAAADIDVRFVASGSGNWPSGFTVTCATLARPGD